MGAEIGIGQSQKSNIGKSKRVGIAPQRYASLQDLIQAGWLKIPLEIRGKRDGQIRYGRITEDGIPTWNGRSYSSLSAAAGDALASIIGMRPDGDCPSVNGWEFWEFTDSDGRWEPLDTLRQSYRSRNPGFDAFRKSS
jgi:hypothetical protein